MKYAKKDELEMIKYLRFRKNSPSKCKQTFMSYKDIAKFLNKSIQYVHNRCKQIIQEDKQCMVNFE